MIEPPYIKLKEDYQHCTKRMTDLFQYGMHREYALKTGIVNAKKQFEEIKSITNDKRIIEICDEMSSFMTKAMNAKSIKDF